jgi:hypothetical protein
MKAPAPPPFLNAEIESMALSTNRNERHEETPCALTSSSWLDDIVLQLIPMAEKHRCALRISTSSEYFEMITCFRVGWQRISSYATTVPPSQNSLDLFLVHWSSMLPLLVGFVARTFSREVLHFHIALTEALGDALLAITLRAITQNVDPLEVSLELKIIFSLLSDIVKTLTGYYFAQEPQQSETPAHDVSTVLCPDVVDESLLVPPYRYVYTLQTIAGILRPIFSASENVVAHRSGGVAVSAENNICLALESHIALIAQRHTTAILNTVILPGLYGERWTTSSAKYFGGRSISHSIRFYLSIILTRCQSFLNLKELAHDRLGSIASAQNILYASHELFLAEYIQFLCCVGAEGAEGYVQLTPNRKQQLLVDGLFIVRCSRWMLLLYRQGTQRLSVTHLILRVVAAISAHAHAAVFHDVAQCALHRSTSSGSASTSEAGEQVPAFLKNTWSVSNPIHSWKELAETSSSSIVMRMHKLESLEVDVPLPNCAVSDINSADPADKQQQGTNKSGALAHLLNSDELTRLLRYCSPQ